MKRLFIISLLFLATLVNGQDKDAKKEFAVIKNIPAGYESITWGTILSDARDKIKGKLFFTDEKTIIISKEGELEYSYGFFYIDPALESTDPGKNTDRKDIDKKSEKGDKGNKNDEGKLFYVALKFPYLTLDEVKKKVEDKYGASTTENLNKNQGAIAWNGEKTIIIMWVDRYENKPYCRRITYVSKEITKELNEYHFKVFNRVELDIIKKLTP